MNYITILKNTLPRDAFLFHKLALKQYTDLYGGTQKYETLLTTKIPLLQQSPTLFLQQDEMPTYKTLLSYLEHNSASINPDTYILYFDLSFYMVNFEKLELTIEKMKRLDRPVFLYFSERGIQSTVAFTLPVSHFYQKNESSRLVQMPSDGIDIDISEWVINLKNPSAAINLFFTKFNTRHFNKITDKTTYFLKSSALAGKAEKEFNFLNTLPTQIKLFFPHVGQFFKTTGTSSEGYEIEKIYAFDVGKLLIHHTLSPHYFNQFLSTLTRYLNQCPKKTVAVDTFKDKLSFYITTKVNDRFKQLQRLPFYDRICALWNLYSDIPLAQFYDHYLKTCHTVISCLKNTELIYSHGDLCLSNILYDIHDNKIKLVDPRGINTEEDGFLPIWYDLAKLSHSILGDYDYIINGFSNLEINEKLQLKRVFTHHNRHDQEIKHIFISWLQETTHDLKIIRLVEASLFLSMGPLHKDNPQNIVSQLISGHHAFYAYQED